jgi:hypothetical protein
MSDTQAIKIRLFLTILGILFLLRAFFDLNCVALVFLSVFCVYFIIFLFVVLLGSESVAKWVAEERILVEAVRKVRRKSRKPFAEFFKTRFDAHASDEENLHSYKEMYEEVAKTSIRMLKEKNSNGYTFKFIRWRQQFIKDTTVTRIKIGLYILFGVVLWVYFVYLLVNGKDSDDHKENSIIAFWFFQFLCLFFRTESLARFQRERKIMNIVWKNIKRKREEEEQVELDTNENLRKERIENEQKDFDEFGKFLRNERM